MDLHKIIEEIDDDFTQAPEEQKKGDNHETTNDDVPELTEEQIKNIVDNI